MASGAAHPLPSGARPSDGSSATGLAADDASRGGMATAAEPVLCGHCGRTASNGISCQGMCVADSGY